MQHDRANKVGTKLGEIGDKVSHWFTSDKRFWRSWFGGKKPKVGDNAKAAA
jgi:hypothetical protein